jgi:hypothetical protein
MNKWQYASLYNIDHNTPALRKRGTYIPAKQFNAAYIKLQQK